MHTHQFDDALTLCESYVQQNRFMEALVVCKALIKHHPQELRAHLMLAKICEAQGKRAKALDILDKLINQYPGWSPALKLRNEIDA